MCEKGNPPLLNAKAKRKKMKTKSFMVLAFALIVSFAPIAEGQLPDFLPIGSDQIVLDWAVTNRMWYYDHASLSMNTAWRVDFKAGAVVQSTAGALFTSYDNFVDVIASVGPYLLDGLKKMTAKIDPDEDIELKVVHLYIDWPANLGAVGINLQKNLGKLADITLDSFKGFEMPLKQAVVRVQGLEKLEIAVESDPPYTYSWPSNVANPSYGYAKEQTKSNIVALSSWYSIGEYRARFTITAGGVTREYTQLGFPIVPPVVKMLSPSELELTVTPGSDTTVEMTTDMVTWTTMRKISWYSGSDIERVAVYPVLPKQFFRARSN